MKHKQIEKIKREIAWEVKKVEIYLLKIETAEKKIQELSCKRIELENEDDDAA